MKQRVLTYSTLEQLYASDSLFANHYADVIHITATTTLRTGLAKSNSGKRWIDAPIISFGQLVKHIGNDWFRSETLLKQSIALTHSYEQHAQTTGNATLFAAFDKNQQNVLLTLRALVEAGVQYEDVLPLASKMALSEEEQLFMQLWQSFQPVASVKKFTEWFESFNKKPSAMLEKVLTATLADIYIDKAKRKGSNAIPLLIDKEKMKLLEAECKSDSKKLQRKVSEAKAEEVVMSTFKKRKVLVFHGFYFITPVQQRFFDALKKSNIEVVHVIHYDKNYPRIFETVEKFLPIDQSEPMSSYEGKVNALAIRFAKVLEGDFTSWPDAINTNYFVFQQLYQFKDYVLNEQNAEDRVISSRATVMEKYLTGLMSASTAELKDYPIGQFLIDIHRFNMTTYHTEQKQYQHKENIDSQLLLRIFSSGYLFIPLQDGKMIQGKSLVKDLMKLQKRYPTCTTFEQWQLALREFITHKQALEHSMTPPEAKLTPNTELYLYPHRNIGYYNIPVERLEYILAGITFLREFYERIYQDTNLSIKQYIEQMDQFITQRLKPHVTEGDKEIADQVLTQIQALDQEEFEGINRKDIIKGLQFFLSRSDKKNDVTEKVEDGRGALYERAIAPLLDADGLIFEDNRHIHLAFMDNKALPIVQNISLWPLRQKLIDEICQLNNGNTLKQLILRKEMAGSITSYLLYLTMQKATNLKISVVKNIEDEHHLEPSFYLKLMGLQQVNQKVPKLSNEAVQLQYEGAKVQSISLTSRAKNHILNQTIAACQRRFILSYLVQQRPDFSDDFHQTFLYQGLVQYYNALAEKVDYLKIRQLIDEMFPQWTATKRAVLYRDAIDFKGTKLDKYIVDGERYLTQKRPLSNFGLKMIEKPEAGPYVASNHTCKYCPFKMQCRESKAESENETKE